MSRQAKSHDESIEICKKLELAYREALAAFKADKTNKDLRRARSAAKKAWDEAVAASSDGDQLMCRDCSQTFIFTLKEQKYYFAQGLQQPTRCRSCATKYQARLSDRSKRDNQKGKNMCYAFQKGTCPYGERCRFSHDLRRYDDDGNVKEKKSFDMTKVGLCKWGKDCKLKKCRFIHPDNEGEVNEMEASCVPVPTSLSSKENVGPPIEETKKLDKNTGVDGKCKKIVVKAMTKALKKAPSRQMKIREVRRLIRKKADFKIELSKTELKKYITEAINTNKELLSQDGKIVRLL